MKRKHSFQEMTRAPCPVCGHGGRCKADPSRDVILCFREAADSVNGFRRIRQTGECGTYVRTGSTADTRNPSRLHGDWARQAEDYAAAMSSDRLAALAEQLHVAPEALKRIGCGWGGHLQCFTFPERDARGRVVGIATRRSSDGAKRSMRSSRRGLILPADMDKTRPLLIVEGASDVAAALSVDLQAVGRPSARGGIPHLCELLGDWTGAVVIVGENDRKHDGNWPGRDGAMSVARSLAVRLGRPIEWALPPAGVKDLREWVQRDVPDLAHAAAYTATGAEILAALRGSAETATDNDNRVAPACENKARGPSQSTILVELAESAGTEFFHDGDAACATIPVGEHMETWPIRSKGFNRWLARRFYEEDGRTPSAQSLQDALAVLDGKALFEGPEREVFVRLGHLGGAVYLDLQDPLWRVVEVRADGWRVLPASEAAVRFRRARGMLPLPEPEGGGSLADLRRFINVGDGEAFVLTVAWLIGALQPSGPYPVLALHGEQGSAKSCTCRVLRRLVDPNEAELRSEPRDERDLVIAGNNGWLLALDNLSRLPAWLSDALCRIASGGGFATRELYTNSEETIFSSQRPILLNGIEELATRPDLLNRAIVLTLPAIDEHRRRDEADLWAAFEAARPQVLGALLTATSAALRERATVRLDRPPRMADFAKAIVAAEQGAAVPWPRGAFLQAYGNNRAAAVETAIDASPIGPALLTWLDRRTAGWAGTASELLSEMEAVAEERIKRLKSWPRTGRGVSGALRRLAPALRARGVHVAWADRSARARTITIEKAGAEPSPPSLPSSNPAGEVTNGDSVNSPVTVDDGRMTVGDRTAEHNRHCENPFFRPKNGARDGSDGDDGSLPVNSGGNGIPAPDPPELDQECEVIGQDPPSPIPKSPEPATEGSSASIPEELDNEFAEDVSAAVEVLGEVLPGFQPDGTAGCP